MEYVYPKPRPIVTVDIALFRCPDFNDMYNTAEVLLIRRGKPPFEGCYALPGGHVEYNEDLTRAATRELLEETSILYEDMPQVYTSGTPGRDPRGHTISVLYTAYETGYSEAIAGDDAIEVVWVPFKDLHNTILAFDHTHLVTKAFEFWRS